MQIYVSNLGSQVTDESLGALFATHGAVASSRVILDDETGNSRGIAYIEMQNTDHAVKAIARINGSVVDGRFIRVQEATRSTPF